MARLSDDEVERIKTDISLLRLVEAKGIQLEKKGSDYHGCCPFHEDDSPSLVVSPEKNLYHCFGCGAAGSVIDWVMQIEGVSLRHALEILKSDYLPTGEAKPIKKNTVVKLPSLAASADHQSQLQQVIDYYHQCLKESPEVLDYLDKRGLNHPELIDAFKLGYANRTLAYRLPQKNRKEGAEVRGQLQEIGILRESGHEHFNGSLVVPVIDGFGVIHEVYGRKIRDNLRQGTAYHLYLPGPHAGIWNEGALTASREIILCESLIDAMTFWVNGFRNVTCSYGVNGFTEELQKAFIDQKIERVLIAYDRDKAGNDAAEALSAKLNGQGIETFRILFPKNMDANSYALSVTPAAKSLGLVIRQAEWMGKSLPRTRSGGKAPSITTATSLSPLAASFNLASDEPPQGFDVETGEIFEDQTEKEEMATALQAAEEPSASPLPAMQTLEVEAEQSPHETLIMLDGRRYRVRGLEKNLSHEVLKVNLMVRQDERFHVDLVDLYSAKQRTQFIKQAACELAVDENHLRRDMGQLLLKLETLQEQQIQKVREGNKAKAVQIEAKDKQAALALLKDPDLLKIILDDFNRCGIIGEESNKLTGYLAAVSRKLDRPLAILIQSSSAAGKSSLMDACLSFMPEEERITYSAMTGQSLYYMGNLELKHKILAISEEEGVSQAAYALKLLQSEGELTIASTGKDATTGNLVTQEYRVEGPVMLFLTTTAAEIDEELLNRCVVLTVNESREQTDAIHRQQRFDETLEGLLAKQERSDRLALHHNAQRLLRPLKVVNPYAQLLTFQSTQTRTRRDHKKYLTLIRTIALLHQYQREVKRVKHNGELLEYIEVTLKDIELANRLAGEILGRTLDELPPQTRRLLQLIHQWVQSQCQQEKLSQSDYRFSRRQLREAIGWGNTQLKIHLQRLEELEYLIAHRGTRGQSYVYELLYSGEGDNGNAFMLGLLDLDQLKICDYDKKKSGVNGEKSGSGRPLVGAWSGGGRGCEIPAIPGIESLDDESLQNLLECTSRRKGNGQSYRTGGNGKNPSFLVAEGSA